VLEYALLMGLGCLLPTAAFWMLYYKELSAHGGAIIKFMLLVSGSWYVLDVLAFRWNVWYLGASMHLGLWVAGLPVEEWMFVLFVPFSFVTYTLVARRMMGV